MLTWLECQLFTKLVGIVVGCIHKVVIDKFILITFGKIELNKHFIFFWT